MKLGNVSRKIYILKYNDFIISIITEPKLYELDVSLSLIFTN
jgi:hypothetical protein